MISLCTKFATEKGPDFWNKSVNAEGYRVTADFEDLYKSMWHEIILQPFSKAPDHTKLRTKPKNTDVFKDLATIERERYETSFLQATKGYGQGGYWHWGTQNLSYATMLHHDRPVYEQSKCKGLNDLASLPELLPYAREEFKTIERLDGTVHTDYRVYLKIPKDGIKFDSKNRYGETETFYLHYCLPSYEWYGKEYRPDAPEESFISPIFSLIGRHNAGPNTKAAWNVWDSTLLNAWPFTLIQYPGGYSVSAEYEVPIGHFMGFKTLQNKIVCKEDYLFADHEKPKAMPKYWHIVGSDIEIEITEYLSITKTPSKDFLHELTPVPRFGEAALRAENIDKYPFELQSTPDKTETLLYWQLKTAHDFYNEPGGVPVRAMYEVAHRFDPKKEASALRASSKDLYDYYRQLDNRSLAKKLEEANSVQNPHTPESSYFVIPFQTHRALLSPEPKVFWGEDNPDLTSEKTEKLKETKKHSLTVSKKPGASKPKKPEREKTTEPSKAAEAIDSQEEDTETSPKRNSRRSGAMVPKVRP